MQGLNGFGQFTLEGPLEVDVLQELGQAVLLAVEDLEAHGAAAGQPLAGQVDAQAVDQGLGHQDGGAAVGQLGRDVALVQLIEGAVGVIMGILGFVAFATGASGWCGIYAAMKKPAIKVEVSDSEKV